MLIKTKHKTKFKKNEFIAGVTLINLDTKTQNFKNVAQLISDIKIIY